MNKNVFLSTAMVLALAACGTTNTSKSPTNVVQTKPKAVVGLALGGGASKGFAHIGVIKVLRENKIPVNDLLFQIKHQNKMHTSTSTEKKHRTIVVSQMKL